MHRSGVPTDLSACLNSKRLVNGPVSLVQWVYHYVA